MNYKALSVLSIILSLSLLMYIAFSEYRYQARTERHASLTREEKILHLKRVVVGVQIDYLKSYLGEPAMVSLFEEMTGKFFDEHVFFDPDYYIHLLTDDTDAVASYAITTRAQDFNPTLKLGMEEVTLGKTYLTGETRALQHA